MIKRLFPVFAISAVAMALAPLAEASPRPGRWAQVNGEGSAIHFRVVDGRVRDLNVIMTVACINGDGSFGEPSPTYTFDAPVRRIARGRWTRIDFRQGSGRDQFDVRLSLRFTGGASARANIQASSVSEDPTCEGTDRFRRVVPAGR